MKLEDQYCSVELAKKLNELGVGQDSEFYWRKYSLAEKPALFQLGGFKRIGADLAVLSGSLEYEYSAFSVAELGEMLNYKFPYILNHDAEYIKGHWTGGFLKQKWHFDIKDKAIELGEMTEADARAKMLIYLLENKLTEMKE